MSDLSDLQKQALGIRDKYSDLELKKYGRNWTTEEIAMGFVGDVGELMELVMAKAGIRNKEDVDAKLAHELSDCLWSILVLAAKYNVDLEKEFKNTMAQLEQRIAKELS